MMGIALGLGEAYACWGCGMNVGALGEGEGDARGCGMNVGAIEARLGGVEKDDGDDVLIRRGRDKDLGDVATGIMDGEADRRRGMPERTGLVR